MTKEGVPTRKEYVEMKNRQRDREEEQRIRLEVLTHYGNGKLACVECGYSNLDALTIDHVNNDGWKARRDKTHPASGLGLYRWLKDNGFPEGFQTLCMNCNFSKRKLALHASLKASEPLRVKAKKKRVRHVKLERTLRADRRRKIGEFMRLVDAGELMIGHRKPKTYEGW